MYYHNSPTAKQLKTLKALKAQEMKYHLDAMKAVTAKYAHTIDQLARLRRMELEIGNNVSQGRYTAAQIDRITDQMAKNQRKAARMVAKLTEVEDISS
jgi:predicted amino acid racemase